MIPFPDKKYQIIYADPPWSYNDKMTGHRQGAETHYQTQSLDWIKSLPVKDIADKDCVLFLWAVNPLLPEAFEVIKSWGFKYKTLAFCWNKETRLFNKTVSNLGRWTMGGVELCLLATKGKPKRIAKNVKQVVWEMRGRHSQKPCEVRYRIVELMGNLSRIELFARQKTAGWDVWGNEV
jgi:site-specific DNA-methyltransferase (adenine-specific)